MSRTTTQAADALVIFGITGDLARKMTFRSLYRMEAAGRLDEAVPLLGAAVRVAPDSPCGLVNLGVALHRRGEFEPSAALLTRALELDPVFT